MSARISKIKGQEGRLGGMPVKARVQRVLLEATVKYQIAGVLFRRLLHDPQPFEVFPNGQRLWVLVKVEQAFEVRLGERQGKRLSVGNSQGPDTISGIGLTVPAEVIHVIEPQLRVLASGKNLPKDGVGIISGLKAELKRALGVARVRAKFEQSPELRQGIL